MFKKLALLAVFLVSGYFLFLTLYPSLARASGVLPPHVNTISIEKIGLHEAIYEGSDESTLAKGIWHKYADRNPETGGNFLLLGHRFNFGLTPAEVKRKSPLYNANNIDVGDTIMITWNEKKYPYTVTEKKVLPETAIEIENNSKEKQLTLYTCTLSGKGNRVVIIAKPSF